MPDLIPGADATGHFITIAGEAVPLILKRSPRARRLGLRVDPVAGAVVVTLPRKAAESAALRFAGGNLDWIARRLAHVAPRVPFAPGAVIPILDVPHRLEHAGEGRHLVARAEEGTLRIGGDPAHFARRTRDYLIARGRETIAAQALHYAARTGRSVSRITLRDTKSRWGSCSRARVLSFSWRLIFCPYYVLDYVVAHEVAHLTVFDHSERFWAMVATLTPDAADARAWLRANGARLHRYG